MSSSQETATPDCWVVDAADRAVRLDVFLAGQYTQYSRVAIQAWIRDGMVTVNGQISKPGTKLLSDDKITVNIPQDTEQQIASELQPQDIPLDILYEDEVMLVIDKPAGMIVHPGAGVSSGTVVNALLFHLKQNPPTGTSRPGIVHRLDKDTSGVLVLAKTRSAQWQLSRSFADRKVDKRYLALVKGSVSPPQGQINLPIERHPKQRTRMAVACNGHGRPAETIYRTLATITGATLLECRITTGRTHQIRVHLQALGHPVLGDRTYNPRSDNSHARQLLHAWKLALPHPDTGKRLAFVARVPEDFRQVSAINWQDLP